METLLNLGLALALGLLVGVERGWQEREAAEGSRLAGIRTFGLIGLLGGLWELLGRGSGEIVLGIAFLAFVVLMSAAHVAEARASHDYGVTTLIAALITFALGALSVRGEHAVAATAAVLTTIILSVARYSDRSDIVCRLLCGQNRGPRTGHLAGGVSRRISLFDRSEPSPRPPGCGRHPAQHHRSRSIGCVGDDVCPCTCFSRGTQSRFSKIAKPPHVSHGSMSFCCRRPQYPEN